MKNLMFKMALLLEGATATSGDKATDALYTAYNTFKNVIMTVLPIVLAVILVLGIFFGIKLGISFAKAEDTEARDKAKGQLINMLIGVGVAAVIVIICIVLVTNDVFRGLFNVPDLVK